MTEFRLDDVRAALTRAGFDPALFRDRQLELLRLPQNLSLFLEAGFDPSVAPAFRTATKLFDEYWENKRSSVTAVGHDRSLDARDGDASAAQLTRRNYSPYPRERLDDIPPPYLRQLASEGVLTYDGRHYGFGHESFFDYCFARVFVNRPESITSFLKSAERHLFRRAQVRQVLAYLRDADFRRYLRELEELVSDPGIRGHLKDLAFALLAEVSDPTDEEWAIWKRSTSPALEGIADGDSELGQAFTPRVASVLRGTGLVLGSRPARRASGLARVGQRSRRRHGSELSVGSPRPRTGPGGGPP